MQVATMHAFGHSGISSTRTGSAKGMIGCARGPARLGFTTGHRILNEVYYPRADIPQIRGAGCQSVRLVNKNIASSLNIRVYFPMSVTSTAQSLSSM